MIEIFGAVGDGITDDTTAVQTAVCQAQRMVYLVVGQSGQYEDHARWECGVFATSELAEKAAALANANANQDDEEKYYVIEMTLDSWDPKNMGGLVINLETNEVRRV